MVSVVVVRHFLERHKASNSARLVPEAIEGARVVDVGAPGLAPPAADAFAQPGSALLFPGGRPLVGALAAGITQLVVPDGTWAQARRMRTRVAALAGLPAVSVVDLEPTPRLRRPRARGELPTAIAIARALAACGEHEAAARLTAAFEALHAQLTRPGRRREPPPVS